MVFAPFSDWRAAHRHHLHHRPVVQRHHRRRPAVFGFLRRRRLPAVAALASLVRLCRVSIRAKTAARWSSASTVRRSKGNAGRAGHRASAAADAVQLDGVRERRRRAPLRAREPGAQRSQGATGPGTASSRASTRLTCRSTQAIWVTRSRYGETDQRASSARRGTRDALGFYRWFADLPAFDGLSGDPACACFVDLRFLTPGRDGMPFRYGACRDGPGGPWRLAAAGGLRRS